MPAVEFETEFWFIIIVLNDLTTIAVVQDKTDIVYITSVFWAVRDLCTPVPHSNNSWMSLKDNSIYPPSKNIKHSVIDTCLSNIRTSLSLSRTLLPTTLQLNLDHDLPYTRSLHLLQLASPHSSQNNNNINANPNTHHNFRTHKNNSKDVLISFMKQIDKQPQDPHKNRIDTLPPEPGSAELEVRELYDDEDYVYGELEVKD